MLIDTQIKKEIMVISQTDLVERADLLSKEDLEAGNV